jgi:ATP-dependent Clp protease ATP-binding subunit ClpC
MTSNIGVKMLQDFGSGIGFKSGANSYIEEEYKRDMLKKELKKFFAPEFLNRIDEVIVFNNLKKEQIAEIVKIELNKLSNRLTGLRYKINFTDSIVDLISEIGFDEMYGARPLKRAIQDKIEDYISEEVLKGSITEDKEYELVAEEGNVKITEIKKSKKKKGV